MVYRLVCIELGNTWRAWYGFAESINQQNGFTFVHDSNGYACHLFSHGMHALVRIRINWHTVSVFIKFNLYFLYACRIHAIICARKLPNRRNQKKNCVLNVTIKSKYTNLLEPQLTFCFSFFTPSILHQAKKKKNVFDSISIYLYLFALMCTHHLNLNDLYWNSSWVNAKYAPCKRVHL